RILILGSFPSVKSRESRFFYGHPQNRFWKLMALLLESDAGRAPQAVEEKAAFLKRHRIACWDSIHACDIEGSSDSSIRNVEPNDFSEILSSCNIRNIYTNGKKSHEIYARYCLPMTGVEDICLPSTSPANAAWSLEKLAEAWGVVLADLK
ncbi:MAG: DNA-deoxyinosine glycosylase, partial [Lachnospiraceae bacterium]|nr:DNA-deoxyinosine glycosylase [Lachnospiraceae bacterium]